MENYFNYFTEIEEHFQKRRQSLKLLSPLDWALIESFQEAGVPLKSFCAGSIWRLRDTPNARARTKA